LIYVYFILLFFLIQHQQLRLLAYNNNNIGFIYCVPIYLYKWYKYKIILWYNYLSLIIYICILVPQPKYSERTKIWVLYSFLYFVVLIFFLCCTIRVLFNFLFFFCFGITPILSCLVCGKPNQIYLTI